MDSMDSITFGILAIITSCGIGFITVAINEEKQRILEKNKLIATSKFKNRTRIVNF